MSNKLILSILISFLCACGGGSDSTPSNNSSTNDSTNTVVNSDDSTNTDVNSDDSDQDSVNSTPTEPGYTCRIDEPYYPLPETFEYRKPEAGDAVEYDVEEIGASILGEEVDEEFKSYTVYYNISDIDSITPNTTPPFTPSSSWGGTWSAENLISAVTQDDNEAENETSFYLYPNDGTVKQIKSDNEVFAEYDSSINSWLWGKTRLPKLETFTTFTKTSKGYETDQATERWNNTVNFSINNTSIRMTGIGCIETFVVQSNETMVMEYDDVIDDIIDDGLQKIERDSTFFIHPILGIVISNTYAEGFLDQDSTSEAVAANQSKILSDINFYSDLPDIVNR